MQGTGTTPAARAVRLRRGSHQQPRGREGVHGRGGQARPGHHRRRGLSRVQPVRHQRRRGHRRVAPGHPHLAGAPVRRGRHLLLRRRPPAGGRRRLSGGAVRGGAAVGGRAPARHPAQRAPTPILPTEPRSRSKDEPHPAVQVVLRDHDARRGAHPRHRPDDRDPADQVPAHGDHGDASLRQVPRARRPHPVQPGRRVHLPRGCSSSRVCSPIPRPERAGHRRGEGATRPRDPPPPEHHRLPDGRHRRRGGRASASSHLPEMHQGAFDDPRTGSCTRMPARTSRRPPSAST